VISIQEDIFNAPILERVNHKGPQKSGPLDDSVQVNRFVADYFSP